MSAPCPRCRRRTPPDTGCATCWPERLGDRLRDALEQRDRLLNALKAAQSLMDSIDQGPRAENSSEWRIPWTQRAADVFSMINIAVARSEIEP